MNHARSNSFSPRIVPREALSGHFYKFASSLPTRTILKSTRKKDSFLDLTGGLDQLKEMIAANYVPLSGKADIAASAFVEQIPQFRKERSDESWVLVLITIHGEDNAKITLDISWVNILLSVSDDGSVSIPVQTAYMYQGSYSVDGLELILNAQRYSEKYRKVDTRAFQFLLTTPALEAPSQLLREWLFEPDHPCESESNPSKYANRRRQSLYTLLQLRMGH